VQDASRQGAIEEVAAVVWADREYPSVHTEVLSGEQVDLAKKRGEEIERYLQKLKVSSDIKIISMA